jgi:hypothetical protein
MKNAGSSPAFFSATSGRNEYAGTAPRFVQPLPQKIDGFIPAIFI